MNQSHQKDEITIEKLRKIPGYEKLGDDDLRKILGSIKELTLILNLTPHDDSKREVF